MFELLSEITPNENEPLTLSLDELARVGAKKLLAHALNLEVAEYIKKCSHLKDDNGHRIVVRNGKSKTRNITVGSGTIDVQAPRINDRRDGFSYSSLILPRYSRKSPNVESVLPILYLKGLSGNAFYDALHGLLGDNVKGLSASSISSLKKCWEKELVEWNKRKINDRIAYIWADGVHLNIRLGEDKKLCLLVLIGVTESGNKKLLAIESGYRESTESWKLVFNNLLRRGMNTPLMIIADGALGLWSAIDKIPALKETKRQRCWVHKIANVLDKMPKRIQPKAKSLLHEMMNASSEVDAEITFKTFQFEFHKKYPKAVKCLVDSWDNMTPFFSFPAEHWQHIRTTNPIESSFSTVKLRTKSMRGAGSRVVAESMAFKLLIDAENRWRPIRGAKEIPKLFKGELYKDGEILESAVDQQGVA